MERFERELYTETITNQLQPPPTMASPSPKPTNEDSLRDDLRSVTQSLKRREPLDATYRRLLLRGVVGSTNPVLPKDPLYKRVPSNLRGCVETFLQQTVGKDPFDRISQRQPLDDEQMRIALNLREEKEHEQKALLEATLAQFPRRFGMDVSTRRKHMNGVAAGLQMDPRQTIRVAPQPVTAAASSGHGSSSSSSSKNKKPTLAAQQTEQARQNAERERQAAQAKDREAARLKRAEEEKATQLEHQKKTKPETPEQAQGRALHKLYNPICTKVRVAVCFC